MIKILATIAALLLAGPALAQDHGAKDAKPEKAKPDPNSEFGDMLRMEHIGVPMVADKRYAGYVMFSAAYKIPRLKLEASKPKLFELQDAILRDFNRRPLRPEKSDVAEVSRRIMIVAQEVMGPGIVFDVELSRFAKTN